MRKFDSLNEIVINCQSYAEVLRLYNLPLNSGNYSTLKRHIKVQKIDVYHFDGGVSKRDFTDIRKLKISLDKILISESTYSNISNLKNRLYNEGLKERKCELCGQDEIWRDSKISLILDHINGVNDDHRIENLRIVCPNCNATLPTHCGKNRKKLSYCKCGEKKYKTSILCKSCNDLMKRKKERPTLERLEIDIKQLGYLKTGKKYGVSDNTIRKWIIK